VLSVTLVFQSCLTSHSNAVVQGNEAIVLGGADAGCNVRDGMK
jgi:hypothetical protein